MEVIINTSLATHRHIVRDERDILILAHLLYCQYASEDNDWNSGQD